MGTGRFQHEGGTQVCALPSTETWFRASTAPHRHPGQLAEAHPDPAPADPKDHDTNSARCLSPPVSSRRRSLCVPVEEFEFDAQHVVEALASLVDVVVAAATAMELAAGGSFGDAQR